MTRRFADARRSRYADQRGFVIVAILALMLIVLAIGFAALAETLSSRQLTTHDMRVRRAQQAADAGIQQQLYDESEANLGSVYNFSGGVLGLSGFLDCVPLQLNANLQVGGLTAYASAGGACPTALNSSGAPVSAYWSPLDDHAYYEAEYFSNKHEIGGSGVGSVVEFPEIVSVGCDTTTPSSCNTTPTPSSNAYARELALLQPTGPVQALEGMGNVTVNGLSVLGVNAVGVVNGDISAGGTLTLPLLGVAADTSWPTGSDAILPTFGYGQTPAPASIATATLVHLTGGFCTAGSPSAYCMIQRPVPTTSATTCALCSTGITCASCTGGGYSSTNDTFTLTGGTATFAAGDYVFCNFNATGGTINTSASSTSPVRIFILPPNSAPCNGYTYTAAQEVGGKVGDFNASQGLNNGLLGTVNGVTNTLDPSGVQVYVEGDGSYDNNTTVSIGNSSTCTVYVLSVCTVAAAPNEGMVIYAPTSSVTVNTKSCVLGLVCAAGAFVGSIVGDNVTASASAITQDLDLGNYPVDSGANAVRVNEYVQCDTSVSSLSNSLSADTSGC